MRKLLVFVFMLFGLLSLLSCGEEKYDVVVTNYVGYDAVKASTSAIDSIKVKMIIAPGAEIHHYELSMSDTRAIYNAKLFVYVGGESDEWAQDIVISAKAKGVKVLSMFDILYDALLVEEGEEDEYDEHVWTDPTNYSRIVKDINYELGLLFPDNKEVMDSYAERYRKLLRDRDNTIELLVKNANKNVIVVADRNPFLYFEKHYKIDVVGALSGCSTDGTASMEKIRELKKVVEDNKLKAIFTIELSKGSIAKTLSDEIDKDIREGSYAGESVTVYTLYSMHNITKNDFEAGVTYLNLLDRNIEKLRTALS